MAKPILDDELWALIEPLLPRPKPRRSRYPGRKPLDDRAVLTGILFILQTGLRWDRRVITNTMWEDLTDHET